MLSKRFLGLLVVAGLAGCGIGGGADEEGPVDWESDDPSNRATGGDRNSGGDAAAGAPSSDGKSDSSESANRAVEEADIVKVDGNRLFAMSRYGGLSVIDASNPDKLKLLGRQRMDAIPFEMYVRGDVVYAMVNSFGRWQWDEAAHSGQWIQTSRIIAYDTKDPARIREIGGYDVPGSISDSRIVGDVLYLVTFEDGYCYKCSSTPSTTVTSFAVGDPSKITRVDTLAFSSPNKSYSWWKRSVTATSSRMYIGGPEWNWNGSTQPQSVVQVLDISNPAGKLVKGAEVHLAGQITSRWQMDEYQGHLRVVSQPGNGWWTSSNPQVQIFKVNSASEVVPSGKTDLILKEPESLRSVRFDGPRAYAITAERQDPLFTIDVSDPTAPKQMGELEMPGWVYYMEPRGDRLIGLGFDQQNGQGSLNVSLFDVSDLKTPKMIKRVNFAPGWANLPEDQDRIHKSFRVLDDKGLILVPFASYGRWTGTDCVAPSSGIQLIDFTKDDLVLRGVAPQHGQPRRALIHNDRLLGISDRNVSSFRFDDRDAPVKTGELDLSNPAHKIVTNATHVVQLTNDWWTGEAALSFTPKATADTASAVSTISLKELAPPGPQHCSGYAGWAAWYAARIFANGKHVYVVVPPAYYYYGPGDGTSAPRRDMLVAVIDASDAAHPRIVGRLAVPLSTQDGYSAWQDYGYGYYGYYGYWGAVLGAGSGIVQSGSTLALLEITRTSKDHNDPTVTRALRVVDLSNPAEPKASAPVDLGPSLGATPLQVQGHMVLTSRWTKSPNPGRVRFWIDRVDVSAPQSPVRHRAINVPGSLVTFDNTRVVTVDYRRFEAPARDWQSCQATLGSRAYFDYERKVCIQIERMLRLLELQGSRAFLRQNMELPAQNVGTVSVGDDRLYLSLYPEYVYASGGGRPELKGKRGLFVYSGIRAGQLKLIGSLEDDRHWPVATQGTRIAVHNEKGLAVLDTAAGDPRLIGSADLRGWGWSYDVKLENDRAVAALGEWGLQTIQLR